MNKILHHNCIMNDMYVVPFSYCCTTLVNILSEILFEDNSTVDN